MIRLCLTLIHQILPFVVDLVSHDDTILMDSNLPHGELKEMNQTEKTPTLKQVKQWHDRIIAKGTQRDGAFLHWRIKDEWHIVERCWPIGDKEPHFMFYKEGPHNIRVG